VLRDIVVVSLGDSLRPKTIEKPQGVAHLGHQTSPKKVFHKNASGRTFGKLHDVNPRAGEPALGIVGEKQQRNVAWRLAAIGRIHLIGFLIAFLGCRLERVAERAVKARSIFSRVRQDADVFVPGRVKRPADAADPAIHHV